MSLGDHLAATLARIKAGESLDRINAERRENLRIAIQIARDAFSQAGMSDVDADAKARSLVQSLVGLVL